ncbi:MAG: hypothetical protein LBP76_02840 [Treponema sp.]|jgi:hypothetical protein|nr:hypothetical protein [Treponema sp.]
MIVKPHISFKTLIIPLAALLFVSCGIEDYYYLYPVSAANIMMQSNVAATISLPSYGQEYYYFTHFTIYYRIYISDRLSAAEIQPSEMQSINQALYSDYNGIEPYTHEDLITTINIDNLFVNRHYYTLKLNGADIDSVLEIRDGGTMTIDFSSSLAAPELRRGSNRYPLYRSNGDGIFDPLPRDRLFQNTDDLNKSANASSTVNADVANKANISGPRYTYAAMYIAAIGRNNNFSPIYSIPTFIGIFQLPNRGYVQTE